MEISRMKLKVFEAILVLLATLHHLHATQDGMNETDSLPIGSNVHDPRHRGRLVDHDIRLPVGALKEDYYESENQSPPLIMNFEKQYAGRRREHSDKLWTLPIPYIIDNSVDTVGRTLILNGIKEYETNTCIRFKEKGASDDSYLRFVGDDRGCWSYVGKQNTGEQIISLQNVRCRKPKTILHEIMHAVGFWHEHTRPDRDSYVRIHFENVEPMQFGQFMKLRPDITNSFGVEYDYKSIMHYNRNAFSKNGRVTISRVDGEASPFSQPVDGSFSPLDVKQLNLLYDCRVGEKWSAWQTSLCNSTCGEGYSTHTRECKDVKNTCVGESIKYERCDLPVCGDGVGEWSSWQEGRCSRSCGSGITVSIRKCSKSYCIGDATRVETCRVVPCDCFPSNAYVRNKDGMKVSLKSVKIGDEVLTLGSEGAPTYTKIIMMLHQDAHQTLNNYIQISTRDGHSITMSSNHLIPTSNDNFVFAKDVQQGQNVTVYDPTSNTFKSTKVISTHQVTDVGLYAPLSMEGTLIVNDIHVSCYAVFPSHTISHYAFTLWRFMYTYFESATRYLSVNDEVVHWYPRTLYNMASYVGWL